MARAVQAVCGEAGIRAISFASIRADLINSTYKNTTEPKRRAEKSEFGPQLKNGVGRLRQRAKPKSKVKARRTTSARLRSSQTRKRGVGQAQPAAAPPRAQERSQWGQSAEEERRSQQHSEASRARGLQTGARCRGEDGAKHRREQAPERWAGNGEHPDRKGAGPGRAPGRREHSRA